MHPFIPFVAAALVLAPFAAPAETIVLGKITSKASKHLPRLVSLADYLSAQLDGITVETVTVPTVDEAAGMMARGELHMVSETAYGALMLEVHGVGEIALAEWKGGERSYSSMLLTHVDSGIDSIAQLEGELVAFEDRESTSGFLIPRTMLAEAGLAMQRGRETGPGLYSARFMDENERNLVVMVATRRAAAAAIASKDWDDPAVVPPALKGSLRILATSEPILRSTTVLAKAMPSGTRAKLVALLVGAHEDPAAADVLTRYNETERFEVLTEADRIALDAMLPLVTGAP